ncbi:MAG: hypothetical protein LBU76_11260 [Azoarcus sp.]|jgi:hypothetical protein|nr:hypothetical protein [Azoarcus sp.]
MTNEELKKKIAEAPEQEWFKTVSVTFNFLIPPQLTFTGVSAIYEYVNQQIDGWSKYDNLPDELVQCKNYFSTIKNYISNFVKNYSQNNTSNLNSLWQRDVVSYINNRSQCPLPYDIPQIDFLVNVYQSNQDAPQCFKGAYWFLLKLSNKAVNISNADFLCGVILAYEFTFKGNAKITDRIRAERSSISKLKNSFQKYLSESEGQLATHLNDANTSYDDYVKKIDELKTEKEKLFMDWFQDIKEGQWHNWFENIKNEQWGQWFSSTTEKVVALEETYKEKLKLEEPAKYWGNRAEKLKGQGWLSLGVLVILVVGICVFLGFILWNPPNIFKVSILSEDKSTAIKWILVYVTLLSFLAYGIRALAKVMFSSFHLARDCEERYALTYFYLSLLKDSKVDEKDRQLIIQSLFSRADTGLLKDDASPTMPNDIINKIVPKS